VTVLRQVTLASNHALQCTKLTLLQRLHSSFEDLGMLWQ
jgi:hypothetical protein